MTTVTEAAEDRIDPINRATRQLRGIAATLDLLTETCEHDGRLADALDMVMHNIVRLAEEIEEASDADAVLIGELRGVRHDHRYPTESKTQEADRS
jgi:hypothetical protein